MDAYARPLKLLPSTKIPCCIAEPWMLHWHLFATQIQLRRAVHSSPFVSIKGWYYLIVNGLLPFNFASLGKTSLTVEASWHLGSAICLPALKVHDCLLDLTFLHVHHCIIGEGNCLGGKSMTHLSSVFPVNTCGHGWPSCFEWSSSSLLWFCVVVLAWQNVTRSLAFFN